VGKPIEWGTIVTIGFVIITGFFIRAESWIGTTVLHPIQKDASDYFYYAYNMRYHHTYSRQISQSTDSKYKPTPDAVRPPGYPIVLSFLIDGPPSRKLIKRIQLFQMLVSTLTLVLALYFFRCYLPLLPGGIAAILVAISPHLIMFNSYILSETLFCFILVLMGLLTCRYINHPSSSFSVVLGSIMGIGSLIRPSLQFFPLVMAIMVLLLYGRKEGLKLSLLILLGFMLILSPWLIRNVITLGKISDKSLMIGFLHHGMYPDFKYKQKPESYPGPYRFDPRSGEISKNVYSVLEEINNRFRTDSSKHLKWYLLKKPAAFWSWDMVQGHRDFYVYYVSQTPYSENMIFQWTHKIMKWLHGPLVVISLLGSLVVWIFPRPRGIGRNSVNVARFVAALLFYYTILHMIGAPFPRYSVPLRPFQYGMALFCLHYFYMAVKSRKVEFVLCK
jgi:4-amino-4-deoxy-L-arabinose transferase-like glycosyltransferase